mmetsp:Transcript_76007/g.174079  ORF Transcript_76007/g.174079 Transcript_76007/m.174079 type:complete len:219 (-) Transcript_76007:146-802(-)
MELLAAALPDQKTAQLHDVMVPWFLIANWRPNRLRASRVAMHFEARQNHSSPNVLRTKRETELRDDALIPTSHMPDCNVSSPAERKLQATTSTKTVDHAEDLPRLCVALSPCPTWSAPPSLRAPKCSQLAASAQLVCEIPPASTKLTQMFESCPKSPVFRQLLLSTHQDAFRLAGCAWLLPGRLWSVHRGPTPTPGPRAALQRSFARGCTERRAFAYQ